MRNKATVDVEAACRALVDDEDYRAAFKSRFHKGELPPAIEAMVWHYAYGQPVKRHEHTGSEGGPIVFQWQP